MQNSKGYYKICEVVQKCHEVVHDSCGPHASLTNPFL